MLAADKLQLQSALKQQATALKEKEFNLHHSNMSEYEFATRKCHGHMYFITNLAVFGLENDEQKVTTKWISQRFSAPCIYYSHVSKADPCNPLCVHIIFSDGWDHCGCLGRTGYYDVHRIQSTRYCKLGEFRIVNVLRFLARWVRCCNDAWW